MPPSRPAAKLWERGAAGPQLERTCWPLAPAAAGNGIVVPVVDIAFGEYLTPAVRQTIMFDGIHRHNLREYLNKLTLKNLFEVISPPGVPGGMVAEQFDRGIMLLWVF